MNLPVMQPRPEPGERRPWTWPTVGSQTLDGGLRLLSVDIPGRPVTSVEVMAGLRPEDDPAGLDGLTALTARALAEGAGGKDATAFAAAVEAQGASVHGTAGTLSTRLQMDVPAARLAQALPLMGEALASPRFTTDDVERLVAQRLDAITRERKSPEAQAQQARDGLVLAAADRLSRPVQGLEGSVAAITAEAVAQQWARAARDGATVVVVGDLSSVDVAEAVTGALAQWTPTGTARRARDREWGAPGGVLIVDRPGAVQTQLALGMRGPGRISPAWAATQIATFAVGGTVTSRLDRVLREDKGYTYGVRANAQSWGADGLLGVSGSVETSVTGPALEELRGVLLGAVAGITPQEVADAVEYLVGVAPTRLQSSRALVGELTMAVAEDLPITWPAEHLARLRALTPDLVSAAAQAWDPAGLTWVLCGDAATIAGPVEALGLGHVEVQPAP